VMVTGKLCNNMKNIFFQNKTIELIVVWPSQSSLEISL
jgi:hypothetical protein